mgnify:CR=1 FL=1
MTIAALIKKQKEYNQIHNEGGEGYNPLDEIIHKAAMVEAAKPLWTREQTQANRGGWNKSMRSFGSSITPDQLHAVEAEYGFNFTTLKAEIKKHNL